MRLEQLEVNITNNFVVQMCLKVEQKRFKKVSKTFGIRKLFTCKFSENQALHLITE